MRNKLLQWLAVFCLFLVLAEVGLVIVSWLLAASMTEGVRSLLSSEGIRWLIGNFTDMMAQPPLVWLLLILVAVGCVQTSGLTKLFSRQHHFSYRELTALRVATGLVVVYVGVICIMTLPSHAVLLSATGNLFPSAFSHSVLALIILGILIFSVAFAVISGRLRSLADVLFSLSVGISKGAPLLVTYLLLIQFCESLLFVFG